MLQVYGETACFFRADRFRERERGEGETGGVSGIFFAPARLRMLNLFTETSCFAYASVPSVYVGLNLSIGWIFI